MFFITLGKLCHGSNLLIKNLEDRIVPTIIKLVPFSNVCADDGGFAQMSGRGLGSHVQAVRAVPSPGERSEHE